MQKSVIMVFVKRGEKIRGGNESKGTEFLGNLWKV